MKLSKYFYAGSLAVLGLSLAACSTEDEVAQNPVERGVVKTEFNIAIPAQAHTRMAEDITQAQGTPVFRGMEKIHLIPFAVNTKISATDNRLGNEITLNATGAIPTIKDANTIATLNATNNSQLYKDVEVPIGTKSFLFYGVAPEKAATSDATKEEINGQVTATGLENSVATPAGIKFDLNSIIAEGAATDAKATAIVAYLNLIAKGNDWDQDTDPLHEMYLNFISLRAGSSADVQALVQDLYTSLQTKSDATSEKLKAAITNDTYVSAVADGKLTFTEAISGYPANIHLPDGAALVAWSNENGFEVATNLEYRNSENAVLFNVPTLQDYVYPAALYYRANSLINVDTDTKEAEYLKAENDWNAVLNAYAEQPGTVQGNTKSVAIVDQIEYAVGRLDLKVKATAATLQDNDNQSFNVADNFKVTGILIGGQKQVDFEFLPVTGAPEKTIYDNQTEGITLATGDAKLANRTLVFETADEEVVKFAIELQNDGETFRGFDGIVPTGCKFYLIGQIDPTKAAATATDKNGQTIKRVFLQDFFTTIEATITSLKNAYNVVPDLRAPKLELGLSVNLEWNEANIYTVEMD